MTTLYSLTAVVYLSLALAAVWQIRREHSDKAQKAWIAGAIAATFTAIWAALVTAQGDLALASNVVWFTQATAWIVLLFTLNALYGGRNDALLRRPEKTVAAAGAAIVVVLSVSGLWFPALADSVAADLKLLVALGTLVVAENIIRNADTQTRWHLGPPAIAIAATAAFTLLLYGHAALHHRLSVALLESRAVLLSLVAPLFVLGARRHRQWRRRLALSHEAIFYTATLILGSAFLIAVGGIGVLIDHYGHGWAPVAGTTAVIAGLIVIALLLSSGSARSWLRRLLTENFLSQRYDYRREWLRCLATLSADDAGTLHQRAIKALADTLDSPAGALYLRGTGAASGVFQLADGWNVAAPQPLLPASMPVLQEAETAGYAELDAADAGQVPAEAEGGDDAGVSSSWPKSAWLAASLPDPRGGPPIGVVVLDRPRAAQPVDLEAVTLLRVVAREVSLMLAERQAAEALAESRRFEAAAKRFAFVAHDIKNVASQLSLLIDNAEHHLDDPAFRDDMMETLREAVGKISALVKRIRDPEPDADLSCDVWSELEKLRARAIPERRADIVLTWAGMPKPASGASKRPGLDEFDVGIDTTTGSGKSSDDNSAPVFAVIGSFAFDRIMTQLIDNALDASPQGEPIHLAVGADASSVTVTVTDQGAGMSPEFLRDRLFKAFATTKGSGFGLGAYQARELARMAGGDLLVASTQGVGTTATLRLRRAHTPEDAAALAAISG